ncbi:hypothetical protein QFZ81_004002 [Paenibacillus sp. V4I9]|uniref:nuclear transport factor 2 family protein n=1 Tax=Paenibacillus sp. V4I9 TaxID=3042308 RepID=UPI0027814A02|nr:hypothetical protein [Paenibacillus sp. V4I9]MDQ0888914.1 hypothetical protein [Paenibacillus sp. V4I9]
MQKIVETHQKELLRAFNVAFACKNVGFIMETISEDIRWYFIGDTVLLGKAEVFRMLEQLIDKKATEMVISNIITHGNSGSVNGVLNLESKISYAFCNVDRCLGKNAKIKKISSFIINVSENEK